MLPLHHKGVVIKVVCLEGFGTHRTPYLGIDRTRNPRIFTGIGGRGSLGLLPEYKHVKLVDLEGIEPSSPP